MMEKSKVLKNFPAYFAYLLSGLLFFSLPTKAQSFAGALFADIIVFSAVFLALKLLSFLKKRSEKTESCGFEKILGAAAFFLCSFLFSFFTKSFVEELPIISKEFSGGRFSHFFILLSLLLALYIGKRGFASYSGVCILVLPIFVLPTVLTFFNFLDFGGLEEVKNAAVSSFSFETGYFFDAFILCAGVSALFLMNEREKPKSGRQGLFVAFLAFSVVVVIEGIKYLLWFGSENLGFIDRPDRVMLSQIPFMNVQDLFLFAYYISYMLKISVFASAARVLLLRTAKKIPEWLGYAVTAAVFYLSYLLLPFSHKNTLAVFGFCGLYFCTVGIYTARIFCKKRISCKISRHKPKQPK